MISAGMTMVIPFLALFLLQMGIKEHHALSMWTGAIFSATFLSAAVMAPIWGVFADKYGQRANLIRAGIGMGLITFSMAFAHTPFMLLILRFVVGFFSGFITVSFSYLSRITPKQNIGEALGTLQTGNIAGGIIGPLIGGFLSDLFGFRMVFSITGICILLTLIPVIFLLEKDPVVKQTKENHGSYKQVLTNPVLISLFAATFLVQVSIQGTNSMMTIFVKTLVGNVGNLAFLSGLASSLTGIATIIGAPYIGKLGDKLGQAKILPVVMLLSGLLALPQIWTKNIYELYLWRFLQGLFIGGMWPAIQSLIHKRSPKMVQGRAFGVTASSRFLGNLSGPIVGGYISGALATNYVFLFSGVVLIIGSFFVRWRVKPEERSTSTT
jgi:DHA1 family multidrug resistance protein-like MFS transporter